MPAVKDPPANAGDKRDTDWIPGSGRSLEEGRAALSSVLACRIPCDRGSTVLDMTEVTKHCLSAQLLGKLSTETKCGH